MTQGSTSQNKADEVLNALGIMDILAAFQPVLAGTFPLDIAVEGSDLDVICCAHDLDLFAAITRRAFGHYHGFQLVPIEIRGVPSIVVNFRFQEFPIEVFAQPIPVQEQYAWRHMVIERRLLAIGGDTMRAEIRTLKRAGLKTEPAFAAYLHLEGDPYEELLKFEGLSPEELRTKFFIRS